MTIRSGCAAIIALAASLAFLPAAAKADDPGLLAVGAGAYDFLHKNLAGEARGEYRFSQGLWMIKPMVGVLATTRKSVYAYGGLRADFIFADHYVIMPNAALGYFDKGNGKDLGSHLEFKTGAEFAYRFNDATRIGIAFDHISNAGITSKNPGTEQIMLMFSLPLGF